MSEKLDKCRVLLADDYRGMHPALTRLLTPWCDVVGSIYDTAELLDAVMRLRPDVVVLDMSMPGIGGLQACRQVRSAKPDVNVIVCTAADEPWLAAKAIEAGASAFVLKCRMGDDLVRAIQTMGSVTPCGGHLA
jgi:two-component system secretion response regulator SsrB